MPNKYVERARQILLTEAKTSTIVNGEIIVKVEGPENDRLFQEALKLKDVQRAFERRGARPVIEQLKTPVEQGKEFMLYQISQAGPQVEVIVFPVKSIDAADARRAMALPEVQQALNERGISAQIRVIGTPEPMFHGPQIVIATIDDVAKGKLDHLM